MQTPILTKIERFSVGIICFHIPENNNTYTNNYKLSKYAHKLDDIDNNDDIDNVPRVLLVKKRFTYYYNYFINGKYPYEYLNSNERMIRIFSGMTLEEKLDILSMNFAQMWYRIWLNLPKKENYYRAKHKFESNFLTEYGRGRLRYFIDHSKVSQLVWEVPKGRKNSKSEADIHCAIREFREETNIEQKSLYFYPNIYTQISFKDDRIIYNSTYFVAETRRYITPNIIFMNKDQINEISEIRWFTFEELRQLGPRVSDVVKPAYKLLKSHKKKCK